MIQIFSYEISRNLAILLYWVPLAFCVFGYSIRTCMNYIKDKRNRDGAMAKKGVGYYVPTDKLGDLIGRGIISVVPVGNIFAAVFDLAPQIFGKLFKWIGATFDQPLVPDNEEAEEARSQMAANKRAETR